MLDRWLAIRRSTVAAKTYRADADLPRLMSVGLLSMHLSAVSDREISRSYERLLTTAPHRSTKRKGGRAPERLTAASVGRYRASLSAFFGWCVREKLIAANPVTNTRVPKPSEEAIETAPVHGRPEPGRRLRRLEGEGRTPRGCAARDGLDRAPLG